MQAFECNGRIDKIIYRQFQPSYIQRKKIQNCKAPRKEEILKNGVILIVLSNNKAKDATSLSEEDKDEMLVVTKKNIQEFKKKQTMF
jgi:hypothetical protein